MEYDIFKAGVAPGSPTTGNEIKILICYILSKMEKPMSFSQFHEAVIQNNLVNYFDLTAAVDGLIQSGHLSVCAKDGQPESYALTPAGLQIAEEFTTALPPAVREKALDAAQRIIRQQQRLSEVSFECDAQPGGGFMLHMSIPGEQKGERLVSFSVFAPSAAERDLIRRRFLNDPLFLYKGVLSLLTGSREILGELLPQKENLFD